MSQRSTMSQYVHARFKAAFGSPNNTLGKDDHWKFQSSPDVQPIHLLLNGTLEDAVVWIFDSHDQADGVYATTITREQQVDPLIKQIQDRVQRASRRG